MADTDATGDRLEAFGRWLVRERELRGLGRDDVIRATKLAPAVVEALESGEESRMPPRAYVVGYLRAYAAAAGLDADEVVLRFQETAAPAGAPDAAPRARAPLRIALAVAVAAGAAAAGAGLWALLRS
ncbi:MAG TPA: helix-turn-helix transcriptional regulator [Anaeromyxobacter sp.]